ncbi:MAG: hypothetical protein E6850_20000, partial [Leclercia adecarboxylata]|nr:hypothetical protein [Leclercia adecarboxylata]
QRAGISLPEGISAAADIVNLRYKSCPEMAGQDHHLLTAYIPPLLDNPKKKNVTVISMTQKIFCAIIPFTEAGLKSSRDN